jgi:hypothetical protein
MPIRARNGKLEWRFEVNGREYSHITDLEDTARNRIKAQRLEAAARSLVLDGRGAELRLQVQPFISAADAFTKWAEGEYTAHPNSWKRLRVSMTSAKLMFGKAPSFLNYRRRPGRLQILAPHGSPGPRNHSETRPACALAVVPVRQEAQLV